MSAEFTNTRPLGQQKQPEMPTLDIIDDANRHRKRAMWRHLALGMVWMTPVGFFLTHGQTMTPKLETIEFLAAHLKTLTIVMGVICAVSVLAMAVIFRRAFRGTSPIALAIGMGAGFMAGCGPAEIMAQFGL